MPERIRMRYTVALQGFGDFERSTLASFFRLGQQRAPAYEPARSPADSDFIIANADDSGALAAVRAAHRLPDTLFVGARAPAGALAWLARPIEPTRILRELDLLLEQRLALLDAPPSAGTQAASAPTGDGGVVAKDVLVVDDSRIALRFLQKRLQSRGYRVHAVQTAQQAFALLASQPFALVFLDIGLGEGPDGLALCQHIKQRRLQPGGQAPVVVMVTGSDSAMDRVRGDLAGCDAYLTKPLMEDAFAATLARLDPPGGSGVG